jgi:hypothetical protein
VKFEEILLYIEHISLDFTCEAGYNHTGFGRYLLNNAAA